jgi:hypothetical protein
MGNNKVSLNDFIQKKTKIGKVSDSFHLEGATRQEQ